MEITISLTYIYIDLLNNLYYFVLQNILKQITLIYFGFNSDKNHTHNKNNNTDPLTLNINDTRQIDERKPRTLL